MSITDIHFNACWLKEVLIKCSNFLSTTAALELDQLHPPNNQTHPGQDLELAETEV